MPVTLSITNTPEDVVTRLRSRAERNHRTLEGELMAILEAAVQEDHLTPTEFLATIRKLGLQTPGDSVDIIRAARDAR